jgi:hypothetical protein
VGLRSVVAPHAPPSASVLPVIAPKLAQVADGHTPDIMQSGAGAADGRAPDTMQNGAGLQIGDVDSIGWQVGDVGKNTEPPNLPNTSEPIEHSHYNLPEEPGPHRRCTPSDKQGHGRQLVGERLVAERLVAERLVE